MTEPISRRGVLKLIGGAGVVSGGAVLGLSSVGTQSARAQVEGSFPDQTVELPDGQYVEDVVVDGSLSGEYEAQETEITRVEFGVEIVGETEWGPEPIVDDTIEITDPDPNAGTVEASPSYSLAEDTRVDPNNLLPHASSDPDSRDSYPFDVTVDFAIIDAGETQIAADTTNVTGVLTIVPADQEDGWQGPSGGGSNPNAAATADFTMDVTLTG